jgi:hypothetical protein
LFKATHGYPFYILIQRPVARDHQLHGGRLPVKRNVPANGSGDNFLRDGLLFSQDYWIVFKTDFRITGSSTDIWTIGSLRTLDILDGFTQVSAWVFRILELVFQNGQWISLSYFVAGVKMTLFIGSVHFHIALLHYS